MSAERSDSFQPRVLARPEHSLSRKRISSNALKVLYRLRRAGYLAYLVGGGVRDLLLGRKPKDFDIGTNARPEEIRRLFKNSRIIGRRFRLVHIFFRGEIVEVSTFRAGPEPPEGPDDWDEGVLEEQEADAPDGLVSNAVRDDNAVYGTPEQDAWRRDLTVNGLFYDISDFSVIDWVGGLEDLREGIIRTIGPPEVRFEEDPVRMMRALEYEVRLGFRLERTTEDAIGNRSELITEAVPARLTYELMEGLRSGHAAGIWERWNRFGLLGRAFPDLDRDPDTIPSLLRLVDARYAAKTGLSDAAIIAVLFLPGFERLHTEMTGDGRRLANGVFLERLREVLLPATTRLMVSKGVFHQMYHGLYSLTKMFRPPSRGRQVLRMVRHESFPVASELLEIAVEAGIVPREGGDAWRRAIERARLGLDIDDAGSRPDPAPRSRRRRRRRPRRRNTVS